MALLDAKSYKVQQCCGDLIVVSVPACIMMAAGNPSNGSCPATYFYLSTGGFVGKWLYEQYLKLMNNCVH